MFYLLSHFWEKFSTYLFFIPNTIDYKAIFEKNENCKETVRAMIASFTEKQGGYIVHFMQYHPVF